nr:TPM domain-containing protein [Planctomycetota bacterium]
MPERLASLLLIAVLSLGLPLAAFELYPRDNHVVHDGAGVLSTASEKRITGWIKTLKEKTGAELKVATWGDMDGRDLFTASQEQGTAWQLGQAGVSNGVIVAMT